VHCYPLLDQTIADWFGAFPVNFALIAAKSQYEHRCTRELNQCYIVNV
jgi:hypothetical protein